LIAIKNLSKHLMAGGVRVNILNKINLHIPRGQFTAITGASGSGKTTLLGLIAGLDAPSQGEILIDGQDITKFDEDALADLRGQRFGFIFQSFNLIPTLTAIENVVLAAELNQTANATQKSRDLLEAVGLGKRTGHYPAQLSGGEQQRLALARAFVNEPDIILADEPTGNLDSKNGERILELIFEMHRTQNTTIVMVTHESHIAEKTERILRMADGQIVEDTLTSNTAQNTE
jgi:putative ABC transport system ATP-binding protein